LVLPDNQRSPLETITEIIMARRDAINMHGDATSAETSRTRLHPLPGHRQRNGSIETTAEFQTATLPAGGALTHHRHPDTGSGQSISKGFGAWCIMRMDGRSAI
jgi:hypothetical protein